MVKLLIGLLGVSLWSQQMTLESQVKTRQAALPGTCTAGRLATVSGLVYICTATNTWTWTGATWPANVNAGGFTISNLGGITQDSWTTLAKSGGWSDVGGGFPGLMYRKDKQSLVKFRGVIGGGTSVDSTVIATLPVGYRPIVALPLVVTTNTGTACTLLVGTNGQVSTLGCSGASVLYIKSDFSLD